MSAPILLSRSGRVASVELLNTEDMNEGITAFEEKRTPVWRHR